MPATKVHNAITAGARGKSIPGPELATVATGVDPSTCSELLEEVPDGAGSGTCGHAVIKVFGDFTKQNARAEASEEADSRVRAAATKPCAPARR